jgi:3-deoxy-manno-octulosonate cytidylyltransferase (CMP-KDO synthetase)
LREAAGIIPARYRSSRFPGKPLATIAGKYLVQRVYEQAKKSKLLQRLVIATDDERIYTVSQNFGAEVYMTSPHHQTGTERVAEVAKKLETPVIINIQGDEPLVQGEMIDSLIQTLQDESVPMATLAAKVTDLDLQQDRDIVKVVWDTKQYALYFSRSPLPFRSTDHFWQHIGIYGYQKEFLLNFQGLPFSWLEKSEGLEQLRALENGYKIKIVLIASPTLSVDTPEDIIKVEKFIEKGQ